MKPIPSSPRSSLTNLISDSNSSTEELSTTSKIQNLLMNLQKNSSNGAQSEINECSQQIADLLKIDPTLTELNLSGLGIRNNGAEAIIKALVGNKTLTSLNLSNNCFNADGIHALSSVLETNTALIKLDLSRNPISDQGARIIGNFLKNNKTLQSLCLGAIELHSDGIDAIFNGLKKNKALSSLKIGNNSIGNDTVFSIAQALANNSSLKNLDLLGLEMNIDDLKILSEALQKNFRLTNLKINNQPPISYDSDESISDRWLPNGRFFILNSDYESNSDEDKNHEQLKNEYLNHYDYIQSICNRNKEIALLAAKATPVLRILAPEIPSEIANIISEQLFIREDDAATLRRISDLV
jgi:hypothetical protein